MKRSDYATLAATKRYAGITGTDDDTLIGELITAVSREIDRLTRRHFYELLHTRHYDFQDAWKLRLNADLLSITTVTHGDSDTLTEDTHFYARPYSGPPYYWLEVRTDGGEQFQWSGTPQKAISIAGSWGYSEDFANAWVSSGDTVQDVGGITAAATSVTVTDADNFDVRQTIKVDSEQMLVTVTNTTTNVLTITRGINGTTAATHANAASITIWEVHPPIARACAAWCVFLINYAAQLGLSRIKQGDYEEAFGFFIATAIQEEPPYDVALIVKEYKFHTYW